MDLTDSLSEELAKTVADQTEKADGDWIPYQGPEGGEGWQNVQTQEVRYQQDPPGETVEGYDDDYWGDEEEGYYDEQAWGEALWDEGWTSPADVPEGTKLHFVSPVGNHYEGRVTGVEYGEVLPDGETLPAQLAVTSDDGFEEMITANQIEAILEVPHEYESRNGDEYEFEWDTDVPRVDRIQEGADILYEDAQGVRRVGEFANPTFVETQEGEYPAVELASGDGVLLQDVIAVDQGSTPLEPRDDPFEFDSVLTEEDLRDMDPWTRENVELWGPKLEYTPFDDLGEVPLGAEVEFESRKVNGTVTGEVTGYVDYDADIGETNSLRVQAEDEYVGETTVGPSNFVGFVDPNAEDGLSTDQYLSDPFSHASKVTGSREAGIGSGNTTGSQMKVLSMPNDERVFATPVKAYNNITTGVVSGPAEAERNNLNSPIMINALGGNACRTELVEDGSGTKYIAKEGIEGDLLKERKRELNEDDHSELIDSLAETMASAYFVGNGDLHGANVMVNLQENEATIIDHDSAGPPSFGGDWMGTWELHTSPIPGGKVDGIIEDICQDYMRGEKDIPDELQGTEHEDYFKTALDNILNDEDHADVYDAWDTSIHEPVDGFEELDEFEEGMEVTVLATDGRVRTATLSDEYQGTWYGQTEDNYEISFSLPHHVLEVHGEESQEEEQAPNEEEETADLADPANLGEIVE